MPAAAQPRGRPARLGFGTHPRTRGHLTDFNTFCVIRPERLDAADDDDHYRGASLRGGKKVRGSSAQLQGSRGVRTVMLATFKVYGAERDHQDHGGVGPGCVNIQRFGYVRTPSTVASGRFVEDV